MTENTPQQRSRGRSRLLGQIAIAGRVIGSPGHLKRTSAIALAVGVWLTAFNQGDIILARGVDAGVAMKIALNFLTPFVVANSGLLARRDR